MKFKFPILTYKQRCLFSRRQRGEFRNQKNPKRKILRRKSKNDFVREKEKASSNFPTSSVNEKRTTTHILCHSTSSFENKPLVALGWSSKSRKRHRRSSSCGQSKRSRGKIFFWKEYYIWYCTHNIFNFNKYFVHIIFLFVLQISQDLLWNLCVQISGTPNGTSLSLVSF